MGLKETLKKSFSDREKITQDRFKASSFIFIFSVFVFFLNYFLAGADFYYKYLIVTLPYTYTVFLLSFLLFIYYSITKYFSGGRFFSRYVVLFVLFIIFVLFSFSFIFGKSILDYIAF